MKRKERDSKRDSDVVAEYQPDRERMLRALLIALDMEPEKETKEPCLISDLVF